MPFVQLSNISLAFGDRDILQNITLVLTHGTKAALTGANGSGKSTLMKIIAGVIQADSGSLSMGKEHARCIFAAVRYRASGQNAHRRSRYCL